MNEEELRQQLEREMETLSYNRLHKLGNEAVKAKLIIGHGYRGGKYEILRKDRELLLTPEEAENYLEDLLKST